MNGNRWAGRSEQPNALGQRQEPSQRRDHQRQPDRGRAHVLDAADLRIDLARDPVGELLDRGVEQFDHQQKQHHADEDGPLPGGVGDDEGERHRHDEHHQLLAKRLLAAGGGEEAIPGVNGGAQKSFHGPQRWYPIAGAI